MICLMSRTTYASFLVSSIGLKLCRKSEGLAYENAENRYPRRTIHPKIDPLAYVRSTQKSLREALGWAVGDSINFTGERPNMRQWFSEETGQNETKFGQKLEWSSDLPIFLFFRYVAEFRLKNDRKATGVENWGQMFYFLIPCKIGERRAKWVSQYFKGSRDTQF